MNIEDYEISRHINYRAYQNNGKSYLLSDYPYLDIVLNDTCNKKCNFCIADLIEKKEKCIIGNHKAKIKHAIENIGVKEVLLLGGEVTIKPIDKILFEIIDYLKTFKLNKICITTNGTRLADSTDYCKKLLASGITHINISLMNFDENLSSLDIERIYYYAHLNNVHLRINNNVYKGNNDTGYKMWDFYETLQPYCDSLKFSPLLKTDSFSVVNKVSEWVRENILTDERYDELWHNLENECVSYPILRNKETFGFVEYSMILLPKPIILNYNQSGKLREKVIKEGKINNIKLLSNGILSLSWNKDETEYQLI